MKKLLLFMLSLVLLYACNSFQEEKYRVVIMTDMTHDDGNSLIRYLYYSHQFETEAIIITPQLPDFNYNDSGPWRKGQNILNAYAAEYAQLKKHHHDYPRPQSLQDKTKRGRGALPIIWHTNDLTYAGSIAGRYVESRWGEITYHDWIGEGNNPNGEPKDSDGSEFLQQVFEEEDDRPIYVEMWGGPVTFVQALYRYSENHTREEFDALMNKLHIYGILLQDITFDYFINLDSVQEYQDCANLGTVESTYGGERVQPRWLLHETGHFWYYVWSSEPGYIKPMTPEEVNGHGPMSELYDHGGEGDTPSFLYLLSANLGLNDPEDPAQGSWGGMFRPMGEPFPEGYYHTCGVDRDHLLRWIPDVKNSFLNRLEYSLKEPSEVNHEPIPVVNGEIGPAVSELTFKPGELVRFDAWGSTDPDGDSLIYTWHWYPEASTATGFPELVPGGVGMVELTMPGLHEGEKLHLILEVLDSGAPPLKAYRRFILAVPG